MYIYEYIYIYYMVCFMLLLYIHSLIPNQYTLQSDA